MFHTQDKESQPISLIVTHSKYPIHIYNSAHSLEDNMVRVLQELGFTLNDAINKSHLYTFVGNILGEHFIDARDEPSIIELCQVTPAD
jgi:hypothetical protein